MGRTETYKECDQKHGAYQKQDAIFINKKAVIGAKKSMRYTKSIGLGFKTPPTASSMNYVDKKCPFAGNVSIRGRILKGIVMSTKMQNTLIVRRDYLHYVTKYRRYEKRHKNTAAHCSPAFPVKDGDVVTVGQCRPLSKTVKYNVISHEEGTKIAGVKKSFRMF